MLAELGSTLCITIPDLYEWWLAKFDTESSIPDSKYTYLTSLWGWFHLLQQAIHMITGFLIVSLKSPDDVIQGISKLDNLLKVSVFQIYKDNEK